jgi:hypothetical protein
MLNRLNGATRECLEHCYQSNSWLNSLAEYAERLRADGWSEADIEEVETTVWRILRAMARSDAAQAAKKSSAK